MVQNAVSVHDFIVTEQIIPEAILGLDFLEANKCTKKVQSTQVTVKDFTKE